MYLHLYMCVLRGTIIIIVCVFKLFLHEVNSLKIHLFQNLKHRLVSSVVSRTLHCDSILGSLQSLHCFLVREGVAFGTELYKNFTL